jgi:hypothetical protein
MEFNMKETYLGLEGLFVKGSGDKCTSFYEKLNKPLVVRGIVKRKDILKCQSLQRDYYYIDTGYFGNFISSGNPAGKKIWHRVVKNELQHTVIKDFPSDRWNALVKADHRLEWKGWKTKGKKILLIVPNQKSCVFYNYDVTKWISDTITALKKHTEKPIVVREKGSRSYRNAVNSIYDALDDDIFATVAFNSIAAIESVTYGVPAFVTVPCAALPLASTDLSKIESPYYPDENLVKRHNYTLAYGQFTEDEIKNGYAWSILK